MYLLDTDVLIDIQRGHPSAIGWFASLPDTPSVPGIVVMELIQGAANPEQVQEALDLVTPLPRIWPTEADCNLALSNFAAFHVSNGLGLLDSLIAACAIGRLATLCSFNAKHYRIVPGLDLEQPYKR